MWYHTISFGHYREYLVHYRGYGGQERGLWGMMWIDGTIVGINGLLLKGMEILLGYNGVL